MKRKLLLVICLLSLLSYPVVARSLASAPMADVQDVRSHNPKSTTKPPTLRPGGERTPAASQKPSPSRRGKDTVDAKETRPGLPLINKDRALPADYVPADLRPAGIAFSCPEGSPKRLLREEAASAIEGLFAQAELDAVQLIAVSAYRSYEQQQAIFAAKSAQVGEDAANQVSARPGQSEHQTGLAIDISSPDVDGQLVEAFGETEAGRWLAAHAPKFGFIIRYPREKENITGYQHEPWHLRYVGPEYAVAIVGAGLTLEEYLAG